MAEGDGVDGRPDGMSRREWRARLADWRRRQRRRRKVRGEAPADRRRRRKDEADG